MHAMFPLSYQLFPLHEQEDEAAKAFDKALICRVSLTMHDGVDCFVAPR